jgi:cytochrome P450/NADPH-cytochrome P450 reductase
VEVTLPAGLTYDAGDHLGIVPRNGVAQIQRVLARFKLDAGLYLTITPTVDAKLNASLPVNEPVPLVDLLANRVELQDIATRSQISVLARYASDPADQAALDGLAGDDDASEVAYREQVFAMRKSLLDILDEHPSVQLPFEVYLDMLPPLRPRYYSISSSPLVDAEAASITVGLVEAPARSGHGTYAGVCSNYLRRRPDDTQVFGFIRKPTIAFKPPENPHIPMIMVGPGTGVAPFRGFLQDRAAMKRKGIPVGESLLFFGCRDPLQDFIYEDELRSFETEGVTRLLTAFSREPGQPKRYVRHAIEEQGADVWRLLQDNAIIFVCGDASRMAPDVRTAFAGIFKNQTGASDGDAHAWLTGLVAADRYLEDIWPSGN